MVKALGFSVCALDDQYSDVEVQENYEVTDPFTGDEKIVKTQGWEWGK